MTTVLFDAHQLGRRQTGNETYVRGLLGGLRTIGDISVVAAVERGQEPTGVLAPPVRLRLVPANGFGRLVSMVTIARRMRPDVVHAIYFLPPVIGTPTVLSVHDISFELYPEFFSRRALVRDRLLIRLSAQRATRVVTLSETSRHDLIDRFGLAPDRVVAIHCGVAPSFCEGPSVGRDSPLDGRPLRLLAVGTLQPRKNLIRLLEAVKMIAREIPIVLRIIGPDGFQAAAIREHDVGNAQVEIIGYVADDALADAYRWADMLVYPSIYEGFGLPVIEAMACGTPVVTSTGGSLPEVAGDAAIIVDPLSVVAIADGIRRIAEDGPGTAVLRARGLARAATFTWERSAALHTKVYRELVGK
jgi:glycosyltransferase involved in cell wall biosynthesis